MRRLQQLTTDSDGCHRPSLTLRGASSVVGRAEKTPQLSRAFGVPPKASNPAALQSVGPTHYSLSVVVGRGMEPVGWVIDTAGARGEDSEADNGEQPKTQPSPSDATLSDDTTAEITSAQFPRTASRPPSAADAAAAAAAGGGRGESSSHNSVDDLLRRIARDVKARQARQDKSNVVRKGDDRPNQESSGQTNRDRDGRQQEQRPRQRQQTSPASTRKSRWDATSERRHSGTGSREEYGGCSEMRAVGAGAGAEKTHFGTAAEAAAVAADKVSVAEANPFTEGMWDDGSCRQVLQALFFSPDSAVPAGSTEEYKELEGAVGVYRNRCTDCWKSTQRARNGQNTSEKVLGTQFSTSGGYTKSAIRKYPPRCFHTTRAQPNHRPTHRLLYALPPATTKRTQTSSRSS